MWHYRNLQNFFCWFNSNLRLRKEKKIKEEIIKKVMLEISELTNELSISVRTLKTKTTKTTKIIKQLILSYRIKNTKIEWIKSFYINKDINIEIIDIKEKKFIKIYSNNIKIKKDVGLFLSKLRTTISHLN